MEYLAPTIWIFIVVVFIKQELQRRYRNLKKLQFYN
jgi:hypothetical protein